MKSGTPTAPARAEFDMLADLYRAAHKANVAITGEEPEYFAEYKIADLAALVAARNAPHAAILDFGSGIGNSIPFFRKYFPASEVHCADVSARSIEVARARFPGPEKYVQVEAGVPLPDASQDIVFSACVFHHIPHEEHSRWLAEIQRVTRPGGLLVIYEHNPLNPLTVRAVRTCPLDVNAQLIDSRSMLNRAHLAGWAKGRIDYKLFFPSALKRLRGLEQYLQWLCLGAQYRMMVRKPA